MTHHHDHDGCCDDGCCDKINLVLDDDRELTCDVLGVFSISEDDDTEYIALLPEDDEDVLIYRYSEDEDGSIKLDNIEDDDEYDEVCEVFDELFADDDLDDEFEDFDDPDDISELEEI